MSSNTEKAQRCVNLIGTGNKSLSTGRAIKKPRQYGRKASTASMADVCPPPEKKEEQKAPSRGVLRSTSVRSQDCREWDRLPGLRTGSADDSPGLADPDAAVNEEPEREKKNGGGDN